MSLRDKSLWKRMTRFFSESPAEADLIKESLHAHELFRFDLFYGASKIGELRFDGQIWTFSYSDQFRSSKLRTITEFPDPLKVYQSKELWPFFLMRIPSLRRESIRSIVAKERIDEHDEARLLDLFGRRTVANPFELVKIDESFSGEPCALSH